MSELCDDALANVYMYLDRELDDSTATVIRDHLEDCPPCGKAFVFEERLKAVVKERLAVEVPPEFVERLKQALHDQPS